MLGASSDNKWKDKYRELREKLVQQEQQWSKTDELLRRAVNRVAKAATGLDQQIDQPLDLVRKAVRGGLDVRQLESGLDDLGSVLKQSELRVEPAKPQIATTTESTQASRGNDHAHSADLSGSPDASTIASFLERLPLPDSASDAVRKHLHSDAPNALDLALAELAEHLGKLLSPSPVPEHANSEDRLRRLLLSLVQRIGAIPGFELATIHLQQRLAEQVTDTDWPLILQSLTDTLAQVISSIRAQKAELETFIGQVGQQLGQFEQFVQSSQTDMASALSGRQELAGLLGDQMQSIRANMDGATDIKDLKAEVQASLVHIAQRMKAFREREESRIVAAEQRNNELIKQMQELHFEARRLREENDEQQQQLMLDPLTKVHSRYAYELRLEEEFSRWKRYRQALSYTIWDVDRFKAINDTYGHEAGDRLLQMVARLLSKHTRKSDFLARIGGEEFVLLLPGTAANDAALIANKLRRLVADTDFHYKGRPRPITISCGITEFRADDTSDAVYQRADQALYQAKNQGRNRCEIL